MFGPKCECGKPTYPSQDGKHWVCMNPECDGFRQICRQATPADEEFIEKLRTFADRHWEAVARGR